MNNSIDARLPKTTSYHKEDGIFFIKHTSFIISVDESMAIAELILQAINDDSVKGIVINNREAKGAWPKNVVESSNMDSASQAMFKRKKTATLTNSAVTTMQINRVARNNNMEEWSKGFNSEFNDEVKAFVLG